MFQNILVAIDRSKHSEPVFEASIAFAKATAAKLLLLHVLSTEEEGSPQLPAATALGYCSMEGWIFEEYQRQLQAYENQGLEMLRSYADRAKAAEVEAEYMQNSGSAGRTICEMAQNWGADLIVIGHRGLAGWHEAILGSVSNYVLHHARCSVFTVQSSVQPSASAEKQQATMVSTS